MMHRSIASLCLFIFATMMAFTASSAEDHPNNNKRGLLRNFLNQKQDFVSIGQDGGVTCNPSGNDPENPEEQDCPAGQYCSLQLGTCPDPDVEQQGVCTPITSRCNRSWRPSCGCDGVTYPNTSCTKGVNIVKIEPCDEE